MTKTVKSPKSLLELVMDHYIGRWIYVYSTSKDIAKVNQFSMTDSETSITKRCKVQVVDIQRIRSGEYNLRFKIGEYLCHTTLYG